MSPQFLSGENVRLRAVEDGDVMMLLQVENDSDCWLYDATVAPLSASLISRYARSYKADPEHDGELRLVVENRDGTGVGVVDLYELSMRHRTSMVGIYILPDFRRQGYAEEALRLIGCYCSAVLGLHSLAARVPMTNEASLRLFEEAGFGRCGVVREWLCWNHRRYDMTFLQLIL